MVLIKKHRHIRLLGQIDGNHEHRIPREYRGDHEKLELCRKALEGDFSGLAKILNPHELMKMHSHLTSVKLGKV